MPRPLLAYRIFIASPGGLESERRLFRNVVEQYNSSEAIERGALFIPVGWEDTLSTMGRPQEVINEDLRSCDYFVLVLWDRWGTPTDAAGPFTSGAEEEYYVAKEYLGDPAFPMRHMSVFFKGVDPRKLSDPGPQLDSVLQFRRNLEKSRTVLFKTFEEPLDFENQLRMLLSLWLRLHESQPDRPDAKSNLVDPDTTQPTSLTLTLAEAGADSVADSPGRSDPSATGLQDQVKSLIFEARMLDAEILFAQELSKGENLQVLAAWGRFLATTDRSTQAQKVLKKVLKQCTPQDFLTRATALTTLGVAYINSHKADLAIRVLEQARILFKRLNDAEGLAWTIGNLAFARKFLKDFATARKLYGTAIEIGRSLGQVGLPLLGKDLTLLAKLELDEGDLDTAEKLLNEAAIINEANGFRLYLRWNYLYLARLHGERGSRTEAQRYRGMYDDISETLSAERAVSKATRGTAKLLPVLAGH